MKKQFIAAATLLAIGVNAQVSGPNRPGVGTSPGTFQTPTAPRDLPPPVPSDPSISPQPGAITTSPPRTSIDTPNATSGAVDPFRATTPAIRPGGAINDSRDWERNRATSGDIREDFRGRLTPPSDLVPPARPLTGMRTNSLGRIGSNLNTSGVNTPPAVPEQPLDRSLSAKIRSELSMTPRVPGPTYRAGDKALSVSPETVRDLRITSRNGRVVLEGKVRSETERAFIEQQARRVQGVANIENRLTMVDQAVGAPGSVQSGQSQKAPSGQTPQNSSDLNEQNSTQNLTPDL